MHDCTVAREKEGMSGRKRKEKKRERNSHPFFMAPLCSWTCWTGKRGRELNMRIFFFFCGVLECLLNFTRNARQRGFCFFIWCLMRPLLQGSSACCKLIKASVHWIQASAFDYLWLYGNHGSAKIAKGSSFVQLTKCQELCNMHAPCKMNSIFRPHCQNLCTYT